MRTNAYSSSIIKPLMITTICVHRFSINKAGNFCIFLLAFVHSFPYEFFFNDYSLEWRQTKLMVRKFIRFIPSCVLPGGFFSISLPSFSLTLTSTTTTKDGKKTLLFTKIHPDCESLAGRSGESKKKWNREKAQLGNQVSHVTLTLNFKWKYIDEVGTTLSGIEIEFDKVVHGILGLSFFMQASLKLKGPQLQWWNSVHSNHISSWILI